MDRLLADDIVFHQAGRGPFSGTRHGKEELFELFASSGRMLEEQSVDHRVEVHDVVAGDGHTVVLWTRIASRGSETLKVNGVGVYHVDAGKITEWWVIHEDLYAFDEFFS